MPVEVKGQQLRIRMKSPKQFTKFGTQDVGGKGKLQRLGGWNKKTGWQTQAWRLNLKDYKNLGEVKKDISGLKIPETKKMEAIKVAKKYWGKV